MCRTMSISGTDNGQGFGAVEYGKTRPAVLSKGFGDKLCGFLEFKTLCLQDV